ncbi:hypothetical protein L7F22_065904 [Adiantum nelumboides]|nr:hypothetical protein [Adiantum nelumboides]
MSASRCAARPPSTRVLFFSSPPRSSSPQSFGSMSPTQKLSPPPSRQQAFESAATRSLSLPSFQRWRGFSRQKSDIFIIRSLSISGLNDFHSNLTLLDVQSDEKELPEEEAVCRICMLELEEGNETFKMKCSCKGELALAHKDCAMKWFSVKGNNLCDICNSVVSNLPVLLFRRSSSLLRGNASAGGNVGNAEVNSSWHRTVVLLLSSALTTFWHKLQDLSEFP